MYIEIQDQVALKSAVAGYIALTSTRLLGYAADFSDSPTFPIEVDGATKNASVGSVTCAGHEAQNIIFWFSGRSEDGDGLFHYALARKGEDDQWTILDKIVSETDSQDPMLDELDIMEQFKRFEVVD